ncbi:MAG: right-handed parallel beta-helix repeat-containing protein, partial [Candidatus Erginobacter occultus]|nr:right-handed parallel beta-helix repeat-containing protein [Candidatus Erginobacter occultus]
MLDNYDLGPGDTIYVTPGTYLLTAPLSLTAGDEGDEEAGVRIEGLNGEVILDGGGLAANCLTVTGDYFEIENISATNAVGSGILVTGNHNILQGGKSFLNGGDGVEIRGDYNIVRNMLAYGNLRAGLRLVAAYQNRLENNTAAGNGTREIYLEDSGLYDGSIETRLTNNILSASGSGRTALYVESASRTGLDSDYNLLYATGGAKIGYWGGSEPATFSQWTEASFQDQSSLSANPLFVGGGNYRLQSTAGSYKPGIGWTADGSNSPGLDRGDPLSIAYLEPAPAGGAVNLGAYGNTLQASRSAGGAGRNFYVNDSSTNLDYFCTQPGKTWAQGHTGLTPADPLEAINSVFNHHSVQAGDTIYVDTGSYQISSPIIPPVSGSQGRRITFAGSPRGTILNGQGISPYCFFLQDKDYISIGGFDLANPTVNVLYAFTVHHLHFSRNRVVGAVVDGIYFERAYNAAFIENRIEHNVGSGIQGVNADSSFTGRGNRFSNNFGNGIEIYRGENVELSANTVESSGGTGIDLSSIQGLNIQGNILTDNGPLDAGRTAGIYVSGSGAETVLKGNTVSGSRYGIDNRFVGAEISGNRIFSNVYGLYLASNDCLVRNNIIYDNQASGIYHYGGNDTAINNNVIYENGLYEMFIRSGVSRSIIKNNIISPRGIGNYGIYAQDSTPDSRDHLFDYNMFSVAGGAKTGYWEGNRDTFWSWQTQTRQDGHSLIADPLFAPGLGVFYLQSTMGRFSDGKWNFDGDDSPGLNRGDPDDDYANELPPNGDRINIGAFGDTPEASRSSLSSLAVISPVGTAAGEEKWSREHDLRWETIGGDWEIGDLFRLDYSTDGTSFSLITDGIPWPESAYP